uniref:Nucleoside diphosphate kinase B n=1 Tax=Takifugu rubripes TaxID=31033 RepID=H2RMP2_TAKRU
MQSENGSPPPRIYVQQTLALVKPDVVHVADQIEDQILNSGFTILQKRKLQLSPEHCSDFYADQYGTPHFPSLTAFMSSGPVIAMVLARDDAVAHWNHLIGPANSVIAKKTHPDSLRAKYGTSELQNALHGSESLAAAVKEIRFMFPNTLIEPLPSRLEIKEYLNTYVNPTLLRGLTEVCKHKPFNPCIWLADWLLKNNPNEPKVEETE